MKFASVLPKLLCAALLTASALGFSSCSTTPKASHARNKTSDTFDPPAHRPKDPNAVVLKVSTGAQRVYVVENGRVLLATPCSVGTAKDPTPRGNFRLTYKNATRRRVSQPDAGYPMAYWMEWKPAYGMHWGFVKPYPCTHGCIRLPMKSAAKIFAMTKTGTPLLIATSHPEDATAGRSLPVLDDGPLPNPPKSYLLSPQFFADAQYKGKMFVD
ncbi:MAG: L,D-transpeptidase [Verrucomicrobiaceae bacterium]|nr:MAG: L,D-transpeptidase [Verrucomicrobiaceae bacterium]